MFNPLLSMGANSIITFLFLAYLVFIIYFLILIVKLARRGIVALDYYIDEKRRERE
ncbi:MAG: hypothetical protein JW702_03865 [Clostridiales bacterium]|nr:hypothetical protein [Clostridiales bacterium]